MEFLVNGEVRELSFVNEYGIDDAWDIMADHVPYVWDEERELKVISENDFDFWEVAFALMEYIDSVVAEIYSDGLWSNELLSEFNFCACTDFLDGLYAQAVFLENFFPEYCKDGIPGEEEISRWL